MTESILAERSRALNEAVARLKLREQELRHSRAEVIHTLARAIECRDRTTGLHVERMSRYCGLLAERLGMAEPETLALAAQLHDVGKIAVADSILAKPGPLSAEERRQMERHAELGFEILAGRGEPLLDLAAEIAYTHHERYDGLGYPRGLSKTSIPVSGRIAAVADVFDALTSDRPYRPRLDLTEVLVTMRSSRSTAFDPEVLDALLDNLDDAIQLGGLVLAHTA